MAPPLHRSQLRYNYLQLVPRDNGDGRRRSKPESLPLFLLGYAASCRLTGIGELALPFADCSGGIVFRAGAVRSCFILDSSAHRDRLCGQEFAQGATMLGITEK